MFFNVFFFVIVFNHWQCRIQRNVFSAFFCTLCCYCCDNWSSKPPFGLEFHFVSHRNDLKVIHIKLFMIFMDIKIVNGHSAKRFWWLFYPTVWQDGIFLYQLGSDNYNELATWEATYIHKYGGFLNFYILVRYISGE